MKVIQNLKSLFPQSFSEMAEEFYYFFFYHLLFFQKQMWPEAKHLPCSVSAQMVKAQQSHMQEKTGPVIKLSGDIQLEILLASQLLSRRATY